MDNADPQNRRRLVKQVQPSVEDNGLENGYDDDDDICSIQNMPILPQNTELLNPTS